MKKQSLSNMAPPKGGTQDYQQDEEEAMGNSLLSMNSSSKGMSPRRKKINDNKNDGSISLESPARHNHKNNHNNNVGSTAPTQESFSINGSNSYRNFTIFSATAQGKAIIACALYSLCSVSMVLTNKSLASSYNDKTPIDLNFLLVVFQAIFAVLCVKLSKKLGWVDYPDLSMETIRLWIPVNLFFCAMLFTGMVSLKYNSVPMVTIFKNVTNIMVATGDYFFFSAYVEMLVIASFAVTLGGAIAAGWTDISSSWIGLFWMAANCFSTAGYVLYMKFATKHVRLSKFGMVYVNNLLCIFFLLPAAMIRGEVFAFVSSKQLHTLDYFGKNCVAGFIGYFLNFAALNCVSATGPTTYAVVGSLNKVPVALLGYLMFDNKITKETWFFIWVSLCGGFLYSYAKIRQTNDKASQNESK